MIMIMNLPESISAAGINLVPHLKQIFSTRRGQLYVSERGVPEIKIFKRSKAMHIYGRAYCFENRILLNDMPGVDAFDIISTLVHEVAHLAAPIREHHGEIWRNIYRQLALQAYDVDFRPAACHDSGFHMYLRERAKEKALYMPDPDRILNV